MKTIVGKYGDRPIDSNLGKSLTNAELERLLPFVKHAITLENPEATAESINSKLVVYNDAFTVEEDAHIQRKHLAKIFEMIISACNERIKKQIIVTQRVDKTYEKPYPPVNHRVFHFEVSSTKNVIAVKYTQLGEDNHFNAALQELETTYPIVSTDDDLLSNRMQT